MDAFRVVLSEFNPLRVKVVERRVSRKKVFKRVPEKKLSWTELAVW